MKNSRTSAIVAGVLAVALTVTVTPSAGRADHTADPASVAVVGSLQSELGCSGDWQPECAASELAFDVDDGVWQAAYNIPAGAWEY